MPMCAICGEETNRVTKCKMCGERFGACCVGPEKNLCWYCSDDGEDIDDDDDDDDYSEPDYNQ